MEELSVCESLPSASSVSHRSIHSCTCHSQAPPPKCPLPPQMWHFPNHHPPLSQALSQCLVLHQLVIEPKLQMPCTHSAFILHLLQLREPLKSVSISGLPLTPKAWQVVGIAAWSVSKDRLSLHWGGLKGPAKHCLLSRQHGVLRVLIGGGWRHHWGFIGSLGHTWAEDAGDASDTSPGCYRKTQFTRA
jgi:hypothetical protein